MPLIGNDIRRYECGMFRFGANCSCILPDKQDRTRRDSQKSMAGARALHGRAA
jgi:hypothetical protein